MAECSRSYENKGNEKGQRRADTALKKKIIYPTILLTYND